MGTVENAGSSTPGRGPGRKHQASRFVAFPSKGLLILLPNLLLSRILMHVSG